MSANKSVTSSAFSATEPSCTTWSLTCVSGAYVLREQPVYEVLDLGRVLGAEVQVVEGADLGGEQDVVVEEDEGAAQIVEDQVPDDGRLSPHQLAGPRGLEDEEEGVDCGAEHQVDAALHERSDAGLDADQVDQHEVQRDDVAVVQVPDAVEQHQVDSEQDRQQPEDCEIHRHFVVAVEGGGQEHHDDAQRDHPREEGDDDLCEGGLRRSGPRSLSGCPARGCL